MNPAGIVLMPLEDVTRARGLVVQPGLVKIDVLAKQLLHRAQDALGNDQNEVTLLDERGSHPLPRMDKLALARRLVAEIASRLPR